MINLDTTTTPLATIIIIAITVIVLAVIAAVIISWIKSLKLGPLQVQIAREHAGNTNFYYMNTENAEHDQAMREKIADVTDSLRLKLLNVLADYHVCSIIRVAVADNAVIPLNRAGYNNHFNRLLSTENYPTYRDKLISQIMDRYVAMHISTKEIRCTITEYFPSWDEVRDRVIEVVDYWLSQVVSIVIQTCEAKIEVYKKHEKEFEDDTYRKEIVSSRIEKNKGYLLALERRNAPRNSM